MDKLYIGDIPLDYHYARYTSNYIELHNAPVHQVNEPYDFYRIWLYDNYFTYEKFENLQGSYNYALNDIPVTNNFMYRRDFPSILTMLLIIILFLVWCTNAITSVIHKGGVLGGLL